MEVNLCDVQQGGGFAVLKNTQPCFKDSVLLNDIQLLNVSTVDDNKFSMYYL